jgi:hypothetical protein
VETPRKFITAKKLKKLNLRGVSTNKTIIYLIAMQTYKELSLNTIYIDQTSSSRPARGIVVFTVRQKY